MVLFDPDLPQLQPNRFSPYLLLLRYTIRRGTGHGWAF